MHMITPMLDGMNDIHKVTLMVMHGHGHGRWMDGGEILWLHGAIVGGYTMHHTPLTSMNIARYCGGHARWDDDT